MIKRLSTAILGLAVIFGAFSATTITAGAKDRDQQRKWDRHRDWRRNRNDDNDRRWRQTRNRRIDTYRGRGYNNGRYGYPGYNNGRYGNGSYNNGRYGNGGYNNNNNYEINRGYQQGLQTGSSDGQRGQSYNPQRSRHFKNASSHAFREGFVRGYDQGYRQYAGYNNNGYRNNNSGSIWSQILGIPFQ